MCHVVEYLNAVKSAVIDLVFDGFEKVVIAHFILAGSRLRPSNQKDAGLAIDEVTELGIFGEPRRPLMVPIRNLEAQRVGFWGRGIIFIKVWCLYGGGKGSGGMLSRNGELAMEMRVGVRASNGGEEEDESDQATTEKGKLEMRHGCWSTAMEANTQGLHSHGELEVFCASK